jgi:hypothetical protein
LLDRIWVTFAKTIRVRKNMKRYVVKSSSIMAALAFATLPLVACGGDDDGPAATADAAVAPIDGDTVPVTGPFTHYVNDTITVPQNSTQTRDFGLNLDNDPQDRPDNALGGILAALKQQGVDIQTSVTDAMAAGTLIILHSFQAPDFTTAAAANWTLFLGKPTAAPPKFDGTDSFEIDTTSQPGLLTGAVTAGELNAGPGNVTIALALTTGDPIKVKLIGTKIKVTATADGCTNGVLGGAITNEELNSSVIPGIQMLMNNSILDDGANNTPATCSASCPNTPKGETTSCYEPTHANICVSSSSKTILGLFDADKNAMITIDEIKNATIIKALLAPDVDLLDATNTFNPRSDGVKDSLSVGIGFTCKKATFTVAGE